MNMTWLSDKVAKRSSPIEGTGLFATAPIAPGEIVVVKGGHVMTRAERDRVAETLGPAEIQVEDDLFIGPVTPEEREGAMMHLNHACEPNVGFAGQISFAAMRAIAPGEELTLDYATGDDDDWEMDCRCGAGPCRSRVTGQDWRLPAIQRRYAGWFPPYLQRRIDAQQR